MAADEFVATTSTKQISDATIRFYGWDPSAISLGVHQSPDVVDRFLCSAKDWDVVRRPTGGRALLHDRDLSYSVTMPGGSITPSALRILYEGVAMALVEALRSLGIPAQYGASDPSINRAGKLHNGLCLDSRVRGELSVGGRKIAAAAQRIYATTILQHGSLPLMGDITGTVDVISMTENSRGIAKERLRSSAWTVSEAAGRQIEFSDLMEAMLKPLGAQFGLSYYHSVWSPDEIASITASRAKFDILSLTRAPGSAIND